MQEELGNGSVVKHGVHSESSAPPPHVRQLLWVREAPVSSLTQNTPTDDNIFLANWIADTKRKQLSLERDLDESQKKWRTRYGDWSPKSHQASTSFLPWERLRTFDSLERVLEQSDRAAQYKIPRSHRNRNLMDTFADSLLHVHRIYNRKFGYIARKVPAHMPHMIDVQVMTELQAMLPDEFDETSSHKLRSSDDMQFAFSYMYFVVGQKKFVNVTELFAELDTDHSGLLLLLLLLLLLSLCLTQLVGLSHGRKAGFREFRGSSPFLNIWGGGGATEI